MFFIYCLENDKKKYGEQYEYIFIFLNLKQNRLYINDLHKYYILCIKHSSQWKNIDYTIW
jgi:hypothetical protein